ncbi:hypothetical protein GQ42DRAFT_173798 [Ramicandelaber brevisporus]|nr:hypothetical protein GQ42DRAFT_173798 [Ramicandelaber brevisporus]
MYPSLITSLLLFLIQASAHPAHPAPITPRELGFPSTSTTATAEVTIASVAAGCAEHPLPATTAAPPATIAPQQPGYSAGMPMLTASSPVPVTIPMGPVPVTVPAAPMPTTPLETIVTEQPPPVIMTSTVTVEVSGTAPSKAVLPATTSQAPIEFTQTPPPMPPMPPMQATSPPSPAPPMMPMTPMPMPPSPIQPLVTPSYKMATAPLLATPSSIPVEEQLETVVVAPMTTSTTEHAPPISVFTTTATATATLTATTTMTVTQQAPPPAPAPAIPQFVPTTITQWATMVTTVMMQAPIQAMVCTPVATTPTPAAPILTTPPNMAIVQPQHPQTPPAGAEDIVVIATTPAPNVAGIMATPVYANSMAPMSTSATSAQQIVRAANLFLY